MARRPNPSKGPRPKQGARLLALRKAAGLTQIELADFLGLPQGTIAFWEWSDKPPRSELLPRMADALGVTVEELILDGRSRPRRPNGPGPVGELQRAFDDVRNLPRSQQRKIVELIHAILEQYRRKAG